MKRMIFAEKSSVYRLFVEAFGKRRRPRSRPQSGSRQDAPTARRAYYDAIGRGEIEIRP